MQKALVQRVDTAADAVQRAAQLASLEKRLPIDWIRLMKRVNRIQSPAEKWA